MLERENVNSTLQEDITFYNTRKPPFTIYGLHSANTSGLFRRMPKEIANAVSAGVYALHTNTAGGRVRFQTDSEIIVINTNIVKSVSPWWQMAKSAISGFDLYVDGKFYAIAQPTADIHSGYDGIVRFANKKMREITINFPLFDDVDGLFIGIKNNAKLSKAKEYNNDKPLVFYGSSITQGACASRPGCTYQSIISTNLNVNFINLGFASNAKAEDAMIEYLSNLPAQIFVCDYDHNAPTVEHLQKTHSKLYAAYRLKNPHTPIIFISKPDFDSDILDSKARRAVIMQTYKAAKKSGDKAVYFIDGEKFFGKFRRDLFTVDGCHPNDTGFFNMAHIIQKTIKKALKTNKSAQF